MIRSLNTYNWARVFELAGVEFDSGFGRAMRAPVITPVGSAHEPYDFTRNDVQKILVRQDGNKDGKLWMLLASLKNGNYGFIRARRGSTGWG